MIPALKKTLAHLFHPGRSNNHRPRILHTEALVVMTLVIGVFGSALYFAKTHDTPLGDILGYASNITPNEVVRLTNNERVKNGLPALAYSNTLAAAAAAKGQDMFNNQYWAHTSPTGKEPWDFMNEVGYGYKIAGENLARDFMNTSGVVDAWMSSPTHRANIVNAKYSEIGIAVVNGHLQGMDTTLVVQMFGAPRTVVAATTPTTTNKAAQVEVVPTPTPVPTQIPVEVVAEEPAFNLEEGDFVSVDVSQVSGDNNINQAQPQVLAQVLAPIGEINPHILFSPVELAKAFGLAVAMLLVAVLIYDLYVSHQKNTVRVVGKNLGHIMLLLTVMFLLIFLKGGVVG